MGRVSRSIPLRGENITLSALDFDAGNMISHRVVSGNADACFYLNETSGVLSAKCDLGRLPVIRRVLNVTATDGQRFADVMPIQMNFVETEGFRKDISLNGRNSMFHCQSTNVAQRLEEILKKAEQIFSRTVMMNSWGHLPVVIKPIFICLPAPSLVFLHK